MYSHHQSYIFYQKQEPLGFYWSEQICIINIYSFSSIFLRIHFEFFTFKINSKHLRFNLNSRHFNAICNCNKLLKDSYFCDNLYIHQYKILYMLQWKPIKNNWQRKHSYLCIFFCFKIYNHEKQLPILRFHGKQILCD